jgi:hypothetical protein
VDKDDHRLCGQEFCPLHRAIVTGQSSREPILVYARHREGSRVPVEVSVSPVRNSDGEVVGGIELFRDLTQAVDDLRRARTIQAHALHSPVPTDSRLCLELRYTPAELVGGDFYRVDRVADDLTLLSVRRPCRGKPNDAASVH